MDVPQNAVSIALEQMFVNPNFAFSFRTLVFEDHQSNQLSFDTSEVMRTIARMASMRRANFRSHPLIQCSGVNKLIEQLSWCGILLRILIKNARKIRAFSEELANFYSNEDFPIFKQGFQRFLMAF